MTESSFPPEVFIPVTVEELRQKLTLEPDAERLPDPVGIWRSHAQAVARWRTPRRIDVLAHTRALLTACGYTEAAWERSKEVLDWMTWRRDVEEVSVAGVTHVLPGLDRIVWCGRWGFLIGCGETYSLLGAPMAGATGAAAIARWVDEAEARGLIAELDEWTLEDWIGPPAWLSHAHRRGLPAKTLAEFWSELLGVFEQAAAGAKGAEGVRVIGGHPGEYFGKAQQGTARWREAEGAPDGVYCGARPGYQDAHLHPALVEVVDGAPARAMDVFDWDELRWALLARGVAVGTPEWLEVGEAEVRQTCELPSQIRRALACLCARDGWAWRFQEGTARRVANVLSTVCGLSITYR